MSLFISYGNDNFTPDAQNFQDWARTDEVGVFLDAEKLNKGCKFVNGVCRIYLCMYGQSGQRYSLKYVTQGAPTLVKSGDLIFDPVPTARTELHYLFHPDKTKPLDIQEGGKNEVVEIFSVCVEQGKI